MTNHEDDELEGEDPVLQVDLETLVAIDTLSHIVDDIGWFRAVGTPLEAPVSEDMTRYLAALGFPDLGVVSLLDGEELGPILEDLAWGGAWSEAEEQVRAALAEEALAVLDPEIIQAAALRVGGQAHEAARLAAQEGAAFHISDSLLDPEGPPGTDILAPLDQAAEDARNVTCQALLVALSGAGPDHPLALKFRLFEAGHWPLGAVGGSFYVY